MRVLSWTIDIRVPKRNIGEAILGMIKIEIMLSGAFTYSIGTDWVGVMLFVRREVFLFPIHSSPRGGKDDLFDSCFTGPFKEIEHAKDIHSRIKKGISHRAADIHLCCMMIENFDFFLNNKLSHGWILNISLDETCPRMKILPFASRKVVDHDDLVASVDIGVNNM